MSLTPKTPIRIGYIKSKFNFLSTLDFIPGTVIRGAVVEYFIQNNMISQIKEFIKNVKFGFFYPSTNSLLQSYYLPLTALTCKAHPGFKNSGNHGVFDKLIALIAYYELKNTYKAIFPVPFRFNCIRSECKSITVPFSGFYIVENQEYRKVNIKKCSQTKVAINRYRKIAEKEMLYSITAVSPNVVFNGKIEGDKNDIETVLEALKENGIGSHTTRGFGKVEAKIIEIKKESLKERFIKFNETLKKIWEDLIAIAINKGDLPPKPQSQYFSIDLITPAILKINGIPTLKLKFNLDGTQFEPLFYITSSFFIGGWSSAWGLPKNTTYGPKMGSTYVFRINNINNPNFFDELEKFENEGIGEKKFEGYGDIFICHPFHLEVFPI
ncbi:MAG: type III-D CRISPR-associated RAMP protein Csx10 [Promethearchaeota archaeon]